MINSLNTPVLFLVFNRPDTTQQVFEAIKKQQPKYLFIAADGPREDKEGEQEICLSVRNNLLAQIDWDCELKTLFRESNIGCRNAVQGAIDWFFDNVEEGIILEDDTLPNDAFFRYCSFLLEKYRNDEKIFSINGCSLGYQHENAAYGVTRYFNMWGWATWKRSNRKVSEAWNNFREQSDIINDSFINKQLHLPTVWDSSDWLRYWHKNFLKTLAGEINTWDYQWVYTVLKTNSFCIRPCQNNIINLGFNIGGTHTTDHLHPFSDLKYGKESAADKFKNGNLKIDKKYEIEFVAKRWKGYDVFKRSREHYYLNALKNKIVLKK